MIANPQNLGGILVATKLLTEIIPIILMKQLDKDKPKIPPMEALVMAVVVVAVRTCPLALVVEAILAAVVVILDRMVGVEILSAIQTMIHSLK